MLILLTCLKHVLISFGCIKMLNMIAWPTSPESVIDLFMNCLHNSIIYADICDADIEVFTPASAVHFELS